MLLALVLLAWFAHWLLNGVREFMQGMSHPVLSRFASPTLRGAELWIVEEGFQDRGLNLYAKAPLRKPAYVHSLDGPPFHFSCAQWTMDGKAAVFAVEAPGPGDAVVFAFAYDFQSGKALLPKSLGRRRTLADWREHEKSILSLAESHGGLRKDTINRDLIRRAGEDIPLHMLEQ